MDLSRFITVSNVLTAFIALFIFYFSHNPVFLLYGLVFIPAILISDRWVTKRTSTKYKILGDVAFGVYCYFDHFVDVNNMFYFTAIGSVVYIMVNLSFIRSRIITPVILGYLGLASVFLLLQNFNTVSITTSLITLSCFASIYYLVDIRIREREQGYERRIDELTGTSETMSAINRLVLHDIRNDAMEITAKAHFTKKGDMKITEFTDAVVDLISRNIETIEMIVGERPSDISLNRIVNQACRQIPAISKNIVIPSDAIVRTNLKTLVSAITNVVNNSIEAYKRKNETLNRFLLRIRYDKKSKTLHIHDNAGGFDVKAISPGKSEKVGEGHGVFLASFIEHGKRLGVDMKIGPIKNGTKVILKFKEEDNQNGKETDSFNSGGQRNDFEVYRRMSSEI